MIWSIRASSCSRCALTRASPHVQPDAGAKLPQNSAHPGDCPWPKIRRPGGGSDAHDALHVHREGGGVAAKLLFRTYRDKSPGNSGDRPPWSPGDSCGIREATRAESSPARPSARSYEWASPWRSAERSPPGASWSPAGRSTGATRRCGFEAFSKRLVHFPRPPIWVSRASTSRPR